MMIPIPTELQTSSTITAPVTTIKTFRSCLYNTRNTVENSSGNTETMLLI